MYIPQRPSAIRKRKLQSRRQLLSDMVTGLCAVPIIWICVLVMIFAFS